MRYVSIDIETTGLDPDQHDIIEIGAVIDDLMVQAPVETLPTFHCYIVKEDYRVNPYCAFLHQTIFDRIARRENLEDKFLFLREREVMDQFVRFLVDNGFGRIEDSVVSGYVAERPKFTAAGKNFGSFDLQFLNSALDFDKHVRVRHRALDPAVLYFDPLKDSELPNMQECLDRAGIEETVDHTGVADAISIIKLIRAKFPKEV